MDTLTALIIAKNESSNIADCVESLREVAGEIIVLDGGSADGTAELAEKLGARVIRDGNWEGFGRQRQKLQGYARTDWCLWLDADERLTPELAAEIREFVAKASPNEILSIPRLNHVFGIRVKHCGYYPDRVLRVHNRTHTGYNDSAVHEKLILRPDSAVVNARNGMLHYTYRTCRSMFEKQIKYCDEWAAARYAKTGRGCLAATPFLKAGYSFFRTYCLQGGFLDGKIGFFISASTACYTFNKYLILYQLAMRDAHNKTDGAHS